MVASIVRHAGTLALIAAFAQPARSQVVVTGTVRDNSGRPLTSANVAVRGTHNAATTTEAGRFRLEIATATLGGTDSVELIARRIGYAPVTRLVSVRGGTASVDFTLQPTMLQLEGVVVTGAAVTTDAGAPGVAKDRRGAVLSRSKGDAAPVSVPAPAPFAADSKVERNDAGRGARGGRPSGGAPRQEPRAGVLTAAVWDDAQHWSQYARFLNRARENSWNPWGLDIGEATVRPARNVARPRSPRRALDLGFLVDATGSMGDEMAFLQSELKDIIRRVRAVEPDLDIRLSVVFYRDRGDDFITKSLPFTRDIDEAVSFIAGTSASGGGDYPEDMNAGLEAIMRQHWSRDAVPQMLFLLGDAPPQQYAGADYTYHEAIQDAAATGIAIYPVAASGVDKPTEFLFRAMAVMTGGKYVFLTDDSGVGDAHEEPDITGYTVEKLNDLMVREIRAFVASRMGGRNVAENR